MTELRYVSIDGTLVGADAARIPVTDRGFLYGDSVFETFRTYDGRAHALDRHLARLVRSAAAVEMALPVAIDVLADEVRSLVCATDQALRVRLMVTRGDAAGLAETGPARRVMLGYRFEPHPDDHYTAGVPVRLVEGGRFLAGAKAGSYLLSVLATREARAKGGYEAILVEDLGPGGQVWEGATSNVFAVVDGVLRTASTGVLPGVTRGIVLELAAELGLTVAEGPLRVADLRAASEVFLTSATRELMPVRLLDEQPLSPGRVQAALHERYRATLQGRLDGSSADGASR